MVVDNCYIAIATIVHSYYIAQNLGTNISGKFDLPNFHHYNT